MTAGIRIRCRVPCSFSTLLCMPRYRFCVVFKSGDWIKKRLTCKKIAMDTIDVNVKDTILKSAKQVFDTIVDPDKMKKYFISGASGALTMDKEIKWEFDDVGATIEVKVLKITQNAQIDFEWNASGNPPKKVTITLKPVNEQQT